MVALFEKEKQDKKSELTIGDLCEMLSISEATAKNWIKLNKIAPSYFKGSTAYFSKEYVDFLICNLQSKASELLKSRRNKKYVSGSFLYKDYISSFSKNTSIIATILENIETKNLNLSETEIKYIIADSAIQLLFQKKQLKNNIIGSYLSEYLNNVISFDVYNRLIDDLIDNKNNALEFIKKYPYLFNNQYFYEDSEDVLGLLYISLSNICNRKAKGSYYTPTSIVKKIINNLDIGMEYTKKILDPGCGSGNFLLQLPKTINIENIYGNDIDNNAIKITRLNMALNFEISDITVLYTNFTNKDFLLDEFDGKFDYIIGNPPWGADFSKEIAIELKHKYIATDNKNIESYDVFIEKSLNCLNCGGYLSFVIPEALLSVKNHQAIRSYILENSSIKYLEFLGNMFDKVQCPSIILQLQYFNSPSSCIGMKVVDKNREFVINKERVLTSDVFSFSLDDEEYTIYQKILNKKNKIYLKDNAIFALGLVTGDNKKYISNIKTANNEIVLKGSDIGKYKIITPSTYIEYIPQNFQQVAPTEYYRADEKLFYKFISNKLVFAYDNLKTLSLNSCNILIPKIVGYNIKYVMAVLNSRVAQFIFEKKYNSIKVLRSHIEDIPIPTCDREKQSEIVKIVDKILISDHNLELYEILEKKIYELYDLNIEEYDIIKKTLSR